MNDEGITRFTIHSLLEHYGAAFKTLEKVIEHCPDYYWLKTGDSPEFYKVVYHTLYFTDWYRSSSQEERESFSPRFPQAEDFRTSKNFHPSEWQDSLSKKDMLGYLNELKKEWKERLENLTAQELVNEPVFDWHGSSLLSSFIYNLRHMMLHIGALQVRLRVRGVEKRFWVGQNPSFD